MVLEQGQERERWSARAQWARDNGIPEELAQAYASLLDSYSLLDVAELAADAYFRAEKETLELSAALEAAKL